MERFVVIVNGWKPLTIITKLEAVNYYHKALTIITKRSQQPEIFIFHNCSVLQAWLGDLLSLKIALRVRSAMFSVTESNSLHLEIFRFFTTFQKKLFRVSAVSKFSRFDLFHWYRFYLLCVICLKVKVSLISKYRFLTVTFFMFKISWHIFLDFR